jgi:hypothetical protein
MLRPSTGFVDSSSVQRQGLAGLGPAGQLKLNLNQQFLNHLSKWRFVHVIEEVPDGTGFTESHVGLVACCREPFFQRGHGESTGILAA